MMFSTSPDNSNTRMVFMSWFLTMFMIYSKFAVILTTFWRSNIVLSMCKCVIHREELLRLGLNTTRIQLLKTYNTAVLQLPGTGAQSGQIQQTFIQKIQVSNNVDLLKTCEHLQHVTPTLLMLSRCCVRARAAMWLRHVNTSSMSPLPYWCCHIVVCGPGRPCGCDMWTPPDSSRVEHKPAGHHCPPVGYIIDTW